MIKDIKPIRHTTRYKTKKPPLGGGLTIQLLNWMHSIFLNGFFRNEFRSGKIAVHAGNVF